MRSHEETVKLLTSQVSELKQERILLLDRLLQLGGVGTLYSSPSLPDLSPDMETEADQTDPAEEALQQIMAIRNRPSKRADAITRMNRRQRSQPLAAPSVAWIPQVKQVNQALDAAEELGKKLG